MALDELVQHPLNAFQCLVFFAIGQGNDDAVRWQLLLQCRKIKRTHRLIGDDQAIRTIEMVAETELTQQTTTDDYRIAAFAEIDVEGAGDFHRIGAV